MKLSLKLLSLLALVMLLTFGGGYLYLYQSFLEQTYEVEKKELYGTVNSLSRMIDFSTEDFNRDAPHLNLLLEQAKNKEATIAAYLQESDLEIAFLVSPSLSSGKVFVKDNEGKVHSIDVDFKTYFTAGASLETIPQFGPFILNEQEYLVGSFKGEAGRIFVGKRINKNYSQFFAGNDFTVSWDNIPRVLDRDWPRDWVLTEKKTNKKVIGRTFFNDISGRKSVVMLIEMQRSHLIEATRLLKKFGASYFILTLIIALIIYCLIHFLILKRILTVKNQLQEIKDSADFNKRLDCNGTDELSQTIEMVNQTFDKLNQSYQFAERLTHLSTSAVFTVNEKKMITSWNKRAEEITGYSAKDVIGKPCSYFSLIPCRDRCGLYDPNVPKPCYGRECIIVTKEGKKIQILKNADFLRDNEGKIIGGIENFEDISEHIKAQKEKEVLQQQVFQTSKLASLGTLGAGIAHELNNPLAIVMGYTDLLQGKLEEINHPELIDIVSKIEQNADRMRKIVSHIKEFSRDVSKDEQTNESINDIANSILFFIGRQLANRNIKIELNLGTNLPMIKVNKVKIQSIFQNLVLNARDELSDLENWPRKIISVKTSLSQDQNYLVIEVADTGRGIPQDIMDKIFEPFFTTKPTGKGTGLGLSLAYGIVHEHQGTITVHNNPLGGACFTVTLPIHRPEQTS